MVTGNYRNIIFMIFIAILVMIACGDTGTHYENFSPNRPSDPVPALGAENQPLNVQLYWSCSDPDQDPLTYQVFFGTPVNPPSVATGQTDTTYNPGVLQPATLYHWKIIATDPLNASTVSTIWSFTTTAH